MSGFEPIAVVGQACVLPGALSPERLWQAVSAGRDLLSTVPPGYWRVDPALVLTHNAQQVDDHTWTDRGGYVRGFEELFDPDGFALPVDQIQQLDPLVHWLLHCGREALSGIAASRMAGLRRRAGVIVGNLSYPSSSLSRLAESIWFDHVLERSFLDGRARELAQIQRPTAINRFMSGLPVQLLARALELEGGGFALDAACASSLYAVKLACDRLHDRRADLMLAGGVNRADDLFIHIGFCALQAMSRSGRSRPFHREADGLMPAEGAALLALRRLDDAVADGDVILGVIRAIGLSNDGRGRGLLAPCPLGQERAMRLAYEQSGLEPRSVSVLECHATGTPVGDGVEVRSVARVFDHDLALGSLKSNLGHLITTSGAAAMIKILAAMREETLAPSLHAEDPLPELAGTSLRVLQRAEPWEQRQGPRRAGINNFGFGGNNAHLVLEQWQPAARPARSHPEPRATAGERGATASGDVAVVALQAMVAGGADRADFATDLFLGRSRITEGPGAVSLTGGWATQVELPLTGLRFPPNDLDETLGQQLMVLRTTLLALQECGSLPRERTAVLIGMQCDAEVARYGARLRMPGWARDWSRALGLDLDEEWLASARRGVGFLRKAAGVVGAMPNIPANRINSQFDLAGPGFTVSAEELSGLVCLELAARALRAKELDAAVVGAVDLCCEPVHALALEQIGNPGRDIPGDAAVVLVLKRLEDARRDGDTIHAVLSDADTPPCLRLGLDHDQSHAQLSLTPQFGHAHAASGLVHLAAAVLACEHRVSPGGVGKPARPWWPSRTPRSVELQMDSIGGVGSRAVVQTCDAPRPLLLQYLPRLQLYEGPGLTHVVPPASEATERGILDPPRYPRQRLALLAGDETELAQQEARARQLLQQDGVSGELAPGIYYYPRPLQGELAFVFTGPAGVYPGMGRELVLAFPELLAGLHRRCNCVEQTGAWVYDPDVEEAALGPHEKLWGSSYLSQLHAEVSRHLLGLQPRAAMGFCSGETNALFAMGAWNDLDTFYPALLEAGVFSRHIAGELQVLRAPWRLTSDEPARWINWRVLAPEERVLEALGQEPRCHLTIVNAPGDVIIGGEPEACRRVVERVGRSRAYRLGYDVAIHCPEFASYGSDWRKLHLRPTMPVPDVRFYSVASGEHYQASAEAAADALTNMAMGRVDFPRLVRRAHADGVRIFVEHGPRDGCTKWIGRILEGQPHLALALDDTSRSPLAHLLQVAGQLWAAGVAVQMDALLDRLTADPRPRFTGPMRSYPAHPETLRLPPLPAHGEQAQLMEPAPPLPPVLQAARLAELAPPPTTPPTGHGLVAHAHRAFLQQQTAVHQQFLAMRTRSLSRLAEVCQRLPMLPAPSHLVAPVSTMAVAPSRSATSDSTGPSFDRRQLEQLASGRISSVLGPLFQQQDHHARQVRLPEPPLLLVDRVTGIAGEPGSMGKGAIWTETDVQPDAWYLHDGYMPSGIVVESGQADLLLISWLGVDFLNQGQRVYRLLGCELTNHGSLPRVGETLRYEIHVDGHARAGAVRLFFFHYDCFVGDERRLSVRNAQAGFFTDEELRLSRGVLWDADTAEHKPDGRRDPPLVRCTRRRFDARQVRAFSQGRTHECFGEGFERTLSHTRTPRIQSGKMLLLDEVVQFDPDGGPWGRGYLRVDNALHPDDWYMQGHFKNDPCMPGTLMCEGCLQAMAFFLTAMGCTVHNDGWRFEPVPDETYKLQCRGQVIPSSRKLTYEVFVEELIAGPRPTIFADILGTCDGLKIFHGRRMGLRLVPDWPMTSMDLTQLDRDVDREVAVMPDGFRFDYRSLLACAWGRPSEAFGAMATIFDGTRHIARLPGPPYHFMSRVTHVEGEMGSLRTGASIELEYDIPPDAWYFDENGAAVMPFCVLLEAVLQPCGWLAVYIGCPGSAPIDLFFRNLDGTGRVHAELPRDAGTLRTRTTLTSISRLGTIILASFEVECRVDQTLVYTLQTGFGFFPAEALASQVGLPVDDAQRSELSRPCDLELDLRRRDASTARYFEGSARLPGPMLLMLDRITGLWPEAGRAGLGRVRGDKLVDHRQWFFKAHFFQDPVQPGSLGLEAMLQLLQFYMLHQGMDRELENPRFEPIALGRSFTWKYRGQVIPERERVTVELEILERGRDDRGVYAVAESSMWVDGLRIYHTPNLAMRMVAGPAPQQDTELLDPAVDRWLQDHRPNWTLPTLPLMSMVDRLAAGVLREAGGQASGMQVVQVRDVQITGWLVFDGPRRLRTEVVHVEDGTYRVKLSAWREASRADLSRFEPVATGTVVLAPSYPAPPSGLPALSSTETMPDPYATGALFHGPAFQLLRRLELGSQGSTAWLDAGGGQVPFGLLNQALLDAAVHGIVHDELERWSDRVPPRHIAYPFALRRATFHGPAPRQGEVRCETRLLGFAEPAPQPDSPERFPLFQIQLSVPDSAAAPGGERVWAELELVEVLIPMGPHADDRRKRIDFRDGRFVEGAGLSRFEGETTRLTDEEVRSRDWLRGSVAHAYAVRSDGEAMTRELAIKDHVAQRAQVHPATVQVGADLDHGVVAAQPLTRFPVQVTRSGQEVVVTDAGPPRLDLQALRAFGREAFGLGPWLGEDLSLGLCRQFLRRVVLDDPAALEPLRDTSVLLLGNHQVQIESMIFPMVATAVLGRHIVTVAKEEHRTGWIGPLSSFTYSHPGVDYPRVIIYFDQKHPASMFGVLEQLRRELTRERHSVFVHVEGELALRCGLAVERISSVFIDLAQELRLPIVPVRLTRGLPLEPLTEPLDFPLGFTRQDFHLGRPLLPDELRELPYAERRRRVLDALNHVGPALEQERPGAPDLEFTRRVEQIVRERGLDPVRAVVLAILEQTPAPSEQTRQLLLQLQSAGANGSTTDGWLEQARRWLVGR